MDLSVFLPDELARYVEAGVSSGRYTSPSEVVRAALRLMELNDRLDTDHVQTLRDAWRNGLDSGDIGEIDFAALKADARMRMAASKS